MLPFLNEQCGNPHSLHSWGREALDAVEKARERVAALIGAEDPAEIVFTSGATEANNWILRSFHNVAISPFEHSSVYETAKALGHKIMANHGLSVVPDEDADLLSLMKINNEIGTTFQPESLRSAATPVHHVAAAPHRSAHHVKKAPLLHSDITQAAGKVKINASQFDFASLSAHKFYGPKGIGAFYAKNAGFPSPLLFGGEQENGARAGTLNVPAIIGMGKAAELARERVPEDYSATADLRQTVLEGLEWSSSFHVNGGDESSPYILSLSFWGIEGETIVIEMDRLGFAISSGAACSSRSTEPSHVLTALGIEPEWRRGTIRLSFGRFNTADSAHELAKNLSKTVQSLSKLGV